ncbi:transposase, partial [Corynebacterium sp. MSK078]|uniref:transposase n=1 Tax=Corynebacterium sp. MSK078 TaxID=3050200 RepID=UPI00254B431A
NKACYMAVGVDMDGIKHILGLWIADNEGAALWASVCADLANRGVQDVGPDPQMVDTLKPASRWEVRYLSTMP